MNDLRAILAAEAGMAAFAHATVAWLVDPKHGLAERLDLYARELAAVLTTGDT